MWMATRTGSRTWGLFPVLLLLRIKQQWLLRAGEKGRSGVDVITLLS